LDQLPDLQKLCPLKSENCPALDEIRRLRAECEKLRKLSQVDTLTGFFNLRHMFATLEVEMERTRRTGLPTALIMIDLDHFKDINDTFGHESGNRALRWLCDVWRQNMRRIDVPCRYGGEEFAVLLPGTHLIQAVRAAERLRVSIENSPVKLNGDLVRLTASFGVEAYQARHKLSVQEFIGRADQFLLEAKAKGRNRVCYGDVDKQIAAGGITSEEREALLHLPGKR